MTLNDEDEDVCTAGVLTLLGEIIPWISNQQICPGRCLGNNCYLISEAAPHVDGYASNLGNRFQ